MNNEKKAFRCWDTSLGVRFDSSVSHPTMNRLMKMMENRGFKIQSDQRIKRDFPILEKDHFEGEKGNLKFKAKKYPTGFSINFYQEVNTVNRNGGEYDFDKFKKMPYLIKLRFQVELKYMKELLIEEGYVDDSEPSFKYAFDRVMFLIKNCSHYKEGKELPGYEISHYNAKDKDGKIIRNREVKYFRDRKGRLQKGTVYHNINNMWWTILNKYEYTNIASFKFFDLDTEENKIHKLIEPSGNHNPKSRKTPDPTQIDKWKKEAKEIGKQGRIEKANKFLSYMYSINWLSRKFQFYLKSNKRIGLQEVESNSFGIHKTFEEPRELTLYSTSLPMSYTEQGWIVGLREYVVHGKGAINQWFCTDRNGEGRYAHKWPEVREKLWKIGALTI